MNDVLVIDAGANGVKSALELLEAEPGFQLTVVGKVAALAAGVAAARTVAGWVESEDETVALGRCRTAASRAALFAVDSWNTVPFEKLANEWDDVVVEG